MNYIKLTILFAALTGIFGALGFVVGGNTGLIFALSISVFMNFIFFWFSSSIALKVSGARPMAEQEYLQIHKLNRELSEKMGIPAPKLYINDELQPNAFATGRSQETSAVCFTKGIVNNLTILELKGVLAHELAHIKNRDVLISTVAAVFAGAISAIGDMFLWNSIFSSGDEEESVNPATTLLTIIIAPILATIIQLAISRNREYLADSTAAEYTNEPKQLASALLKINALANSNPMSVNSAMANLYIQNPLRVSGITQLFSTHPPIEERVKRLNSI